MQFYKKILVNVLCLGQVVVTTSAMACDNDSNYSILNIDKTIEQFQNCSTSTSSISSSVVECGAKVNNSFEIRDTVSKFIDEYNRYNSSRSPNLRYFEQIGTMCCKSNRNTGNNSKHSITINCPPHDGIQKRGFVSIIGKFAIQTECDISSEARLTSDCIKNTKSYCKDINARIASKVEQVGLIPLLGTIAGQSESDTYALCKFMYRVILPWFRNFLKYTRSRWNEEYGDYHIDYSEKLVKLDYIDKDESEALDIIAID